MAGRRLTILNAPLARFFIRLDSGVKPQNDIYE